MKYCPQAQQEQEPQVNQQLNVCKLIAFHIGYRKKVELILIMIS